VVVLGRPHQGAGLRLHYRRGLLRTTAAVVEAIFLVLVLDALFSIIFSILGI
jgi:hypothetical protein